MARATLTTIASASSQAIVSAITRSASVSPFRYSKTMYSFPLAGSLPTSWQTTIPGWESLAATRASVKKRSSKCRYASSSTPNASSIVLTATVRPRSVSSASYTTPIIPRPSSRRTT